MSDWLFDLGNSRFKFAPLQGVRAGDVQAWPHGAEAMPTQEIENLPSGDTAYVASVAAKALTASMLEVLGQRFKQVRVARTEAEYAGLRIAYADPTKFGVDRYLALLAVAERREPVVVAGINITASVSPPPPPPPPLITTIFNL